MGRIDINRNHKINLKKTKNAWNEKIRPDCDSINKIGHQLKTYKKKQQLNHAPFQLR